MRVLCLILLFPTMLMAEEIFVYDVNPVSRRWAILEDNGNSAWLYLTKPGTQQPEKDAFAYSPVQPIEQLNIEQIKEQGAPPILTKDLATDSSVLPDAQASEFNFRWSADGESVSVLYKGKPISMIVKDSERGYSVALGKEGFFGKPWDQEVYDNHFK